MQKQNFLHNFFRKSRNYANNSIQNCSLLNLNFNHRFFQRSLLAHPPPLRYFDWHATCNFHGKYNVEARKND